MSFTMQKQANRVLALSANAQAAYGGILADAAFTVLQRFDPSTAFTATASNRTDKGMAGKGSEWATDDQITSWDTAGTIKSEGDAFFLGWALAFIFGQDVVTGAGPYTHTFTFPNVTATMPCTSVYVGETAAVTRKFQDMAAKSVSIDVPKRSSVSVSVDMVGTGRWTPGTMAVFPALAAALYLLGSDVQISITPAAGALVAFTGRQESLSIKLDRGSAPYQSSGDGLYANSVASGTGKFSVDMTIAAEATDDVNGWFESGIRCAVTIQTNPANQNRFGFTFPSARIKASKVGNTADTVTWALSFDEESCIQVGGQSAVSAFVINATAAYLVPA